MPRGALTAFLTTVNLLNACMAPCAFGALVAFDHAGDPEYSEGWASDNNGGNGFRPWVLTGGMFAIRSSTENNTPPTGSDIDSPGGRAWAVAKNNDPNQFLIRALATRRLIGVLGVGQTVTVDFDSRMGPNEEAGVALGASDGSERLRFYDLGAAFKVADASGIVHIGPGGLARHGMHLEITLTGPDTYLLRYGALGEPSQSLEGSLAGEAGAPVDRVIFDRSIFAGSYAYFNNLGVVPDPQGTPLLLLLLSRRRRRLAPQHV